MRRRLEGRLDPDDVLRGRVRPGAASLCALVRAINPTGGSASPSERARCYALKARLQSLLVVRFGEEIEVVPDAAEGEGVVLLRHRRTGAGAGHAVIQSLEPEARSWVQRQADLLALPEPEPPPPHPPSRREAGRRRGVEPGPAGRSPVAGAEEALLAGREAEGAYDYERARGLFEEALQRSAGAAAPAAALLDLLVDRLGADADALAVAGSFSAAALADARVRRGLALAAARTGERGAALAFVKGSQHPAAASVLAALGRRALDGGDLELAARDLAAARDRDPGHPDLHGLGEAIERARASLRRPVEERVVALASAGRFDEAEAAARDPAARASPSAELRSALRAIDEHRRGERTAERIAAAERALDAGDPGAAVAVLRRAHADCPERDAPRVERLLSRAEAAGRERAEATAVAATLLALGAGDAGDGLCAYLALPPGPRARVREQDVRPELPRLDETGVTGAGARARAAVAAIRAVSRAEQLADTDPDAALDLLQQHGRLLEGVSAAVTVRGRAEAARRLRRREEARRRLARARDLLSPITMAETSSPPARPIGGDAATVDAAAFAEAHTLLAEEAIRELPEDEQPAARMLRQQAGDCLSCLRIGDDLARIVARGEIARARALVEARIARADAPSFCPAGPADAFLRSSVDRLIQRSFEVCVAGEGARDLEARGLARATVTDAAVPMPDAWGVSFADARGCEHATDGGRSLVHVQAWGTLVFVRFVDLGEPPAITMGEPAGPPAQPVLRRLAVLQTPQPTRLEALFVDSARICCVDPFGAMLAVSLPDLRVLSWRPPLDPPAITTRMPELALPGLLSHAAVSPDGRFVWTIEKPTEGPRRLRVVDLDRSLVVHEEPVAPGPVTIAPAAGVPGAHMVLGSPPGTLSLRRAGGAPVEGACFSGQGLPCVVTPHPRGGALVFSYDDAGGPVRAARLIQGGPSPVPAPIEGMEDGTVIGAATDAGADRVFVLHETEGGRSLFALQAGEASLTLLYRVAVPWRSLLLVDPAAPPRLLVIGRGTWSALPLGATPPDVPPPPDPLPTVTVPPTRLIGLPCHALPGPRPEAVERLSQVLRHPRAEGRAEIAAILRRDDPDELHDAARALESIHAVADAEELDRLALKHHPQHPLHRLQAARFHAAVGAWSKVREALGGLDEAGLDDASARHLAHVLGLALLDAGEHEEARRILSRGRGREGPCDLDGLLAVASGNVEEVPASQRSLRELSDRVAWADARLAAGDPAGAREILDDVLVWEVCELQSMARLARAMLSLDDVDRDLRLRKLLAIATFAELCADRSGSRREILVRGRWGQAEFSALLADAIAWLGALGRETLEPAAPAPRVLAGAAPGHSRRPAGG